MRILQLGPMPPPHGGVSTNMLAIHEALLEAGHSSSIVDVTSRGRRQGADNVYEPHSAVDLLMYLLRADCDIVHYHIGGDYTSRLAMLTMFCGILPGKKSVVTFHSGGFANTAVATARPISMRGAAFRSADLLIGVNGQMTEMFQAYGVPPARTRLILPFELKLPDPSVVVPEELENFAKRSSPFLLSVGAMEPEYLNTKLIDALPAIIESEPGAGLMFVGAGSQISEIEAYVRAKGLSDRVLIAGNVEHSVLLHLIAKADVMFRITAYDGDAISVREAIFLGTTVIASDNASRPDGVALVCEPLTPDKILAAVKQALRAQFTSHSPNGIGPGNAAKVIAEYKRLLGQ